MVVTGRVTSRVITWWWSQDETRVLTHATGSRCLWGGGGGGGGGGEGDRFDVDLVTAGQCGLLEGHDGHLT